MDNEGKDKRDHELIRLYVLPQDNMKDFHEVTPNQLEEFITERKVQGHGIGQRRNLYHQLGIVAKVDRNTTIADLDRLLQNDVRTLLVQTKCNKPQDLEHIFLNINTSTDKFYQKNIYRTPIGIAVEINGELLTTGRLRNDDTVFLEEGHVMVLTTREDYKYCCFKEIIYVRNLWRYLGVMKLGDVLSISGRISAKVVKSGCMRSLTVEVISSGMLCSYMNIEIPYYIEGKELNGTAIVDVECAVKYGAHFLVIPRLRSAAYVRAFREHIDERIKLIGSIDFQYLETKFIDIADHLLELDAIWIDNLFSPIAKKGLYKVITQANTLEKAIIGSVPLKSCSDFKKLENNDQLKQIDCMLIEKSPLRKQFPLIVKKLLPVMNKQIEVSPVDGSVSCKDGIVNFVLRTIYSIPCKGIVVSNPCRKAAIAFAIPQIYCPVIAVVKNDDMARLFNIRRNIKSVVCGDSNCDTEYGIAYGRKEGILSTGDFVIAIFDSMDENSLICVNLRAYYLAPNKLK